MTYFSTIRRLLSIRKPRHRIEMDDSGLVESFGNELTRLRWQDVVRICGEKIDKITYEENYLVIEGFKDNISVGELDENFSEVVHEVRARFTDIPDNWMALLEVDGAARINLWPKKTLA